MRLRLIDTNKFSTQIGELLIDSSLVEDNAYNWGLMHAQLMASGVKLDKIINMRMSMAGWRTTGIDE
jgi:hypothetical protein